MATRGTKLEIKIGPGVEKRVKEIIEKTLQDDRLLKEVGDIARAGIVDSILKTQNPPTGRKFDKPEISDAWQERKKRLSTVNKAFDGSSGGGSKKARLIFTGQFLNSIVNRIGSYRGRKVIEVGPTGTHEPYTGIKGEKLGRPMSNYQLGLYLRDGGRDWTGFPKTLKNRIVTAARNFIRRELTKQKS